MRGLLFLICGLLLTPQPTSAQDRTSAEIFVKRLYARYSENEEFSPFFDRQTTQAIATPSLAALRKRDTDASLAARAPSGLNFDPLCACRNSSAMKVTHIATVAAGATWARVKASLQLNHAKSIEFALASVDGAWRIDNIFSDNGDLRAILANSIAAHTVAYPR